MHTGMALLPKVDVEDFVIVSAVWANILLQHVVQHGPRGWKAMRALGS